MPVSLGVCWSAATIELRLGWLVLPDIEATARSTTSAPASLAASTLAELIPLVSCVWKCRGKSTSCLSVLISLRAAKGRQMPAMSLIARKCAPHPFQFAPHLHVVLERKFVAPRVQNVPGIANGRFADRVGLVNRFHRRSQVRQVIQRIKNAK